MDEAYGVALIAEGPSFVEIIGDIFVITQHL